MYKHRNLIFFIALLLLGFSSGYASIDPVKSIGEKSKPEVSTPADRLLEDLKRKELARYTGEEVKSSSAPALPARVSREELYQPVFNSVDTLGDIAPPTAVTDSIQRVLDRAQSIWDQVVKNDMFTDVLNAEAVQNLPIAKSKEIGGFTYGVIIDSIVFKPQGTFMSVYMVFQPPQGQELVFGAHNIQISEEGGIITNDAMLFLVKDYAIPISGGKGALVLKSGGVSGTHVKIDCDGYKSMKIKGEVVFSKEWLLAEDSIGRIDTTKRVTGRFETELEDWNNLIAGFDLDPFQINGVKGVTFQVKNAVFDYSDYRNSPAVVFPEEYQPYLVAEQPELWRGVYIEEVAVMLPPEFQRTDSARTTFNGRGLIIDDLGFTGTISGQNLINMDEGLMNKWAFSLERFEVSMLMGSLERGEINGKIHVPTNGDGEYFSYEGRVLPHGQYEFDVRNDSTLTFPLFKGTEVELYSGSSLEVDVYNGKFYPRATLHGKMNVEASFSDDSKKALEIAEMEFYSLQVQTVKPYLQVGQFSFNSEAAQQAMANFPVQLNNIGFETLADSTEVGVSFDLTVNVMKPEDGGFSGMSGMTIVAEPYEKNGRQRFRFKRLEIDEIALSGEVSSLSLDGRLKFYRNDSIYGEGFNGNLKLGMQSGLKMEIEASAIFGNVNGMRYWYADAAATFDNGIPIVEPSLNLYGFGGGAYYAMEIDKGGYNSLGYTRTGITYKPSTKAGLGVKASIVMGGKKKEAWNGDAMFEIAFFKGGGIRNIKFAGNAYVMTPEMMVDLDVITDNMDKIAEKAASVSNAVESVSGSLIESTGTNDITQIFGDPTEMGGKGSISASMVMEYDFENKVFHANMDMFVNVAGGIITGIGPNGRAGWAVMHFDPAEWYVYIGTPEDRLGVQMGVGPLNAEANAYFVMGTKVPGSPPPDPKVAEILGRSQADLDYMSDMNALGDGAGVGFGAGFNIDTGDMNFLMFYARFMAGAGFDIMLKDYGSAECAGRPGTLGVNGWYANGQAYAYFDGDIGIRVKVFGKKKKVSILHIGAAALLQAKLPNPFWMRGIVGGRYSVLGGLVSGRCDFEVTLGEECQIVGGSVLEGITVISQVTPGEGEEVNVFTKPQAVFNMPVEKIFKLEDLDGVTKEFKIKLDHFDITHDGEKRPIEVVKQWDDDKDVLAVKPVDILSPHTTMIAKVQVSFEERIGGNWEPVIVDGKRYVESKEVKFLSGEAPDNIPHHNVAYSYPEIEMVNFYQDEYPQGYIQLEQGQDYLFSNDSGAWKFEGKFIADDGTESSSFGFDYDNRKNEVMFDFPSNIQTGKIYNLSLNKVPAKAADAVDSNVDSVKTKVGGDSNLDLEIKGQKATGNLAELQTQNVYIAPVRTSNFRTLGEKVASMDFEGTSTYPVRPGVEDIFNGFTVGEPFVRQEFANFNESGIEYEMIIEDSEWHSDFVMGLTYANYPKYGLNLTVRDDKAYGGVPPVEAFRILETSGFYLPVVDIADASLAGPDRVMIYIFYPYIVNQDNKNIRELVINHFGGNYPSSENELLATPYPRFRNGLIKLKFSYKLPGKEITTDEVETSFEFIY
ncbi:hypothetical protein OO013_10955 [Mangrovivirga sp. M17]|uniref:Uncharacterized protein n=1 Tax=Mangrovivirga halotolerans TaxID=2993936 RepID=A0ABT3RRJ0_9BACT|nr:hypothetical protein [Mangrovivirga halotolerans]MCX2744389.1 hypothetical protein [Mangrovivirga halotolerans]